ncbi:MAG: 4Fe-4S double cluster binding domain-containing protein [Thermaceae bacterium]
MDHDPLRRRCTRCLSSCPTGALLGDGTLEARLCVSYWTIEHKGGPKARPAGSAGRLPRGPGWASSRTRTPGWRARR